MNRYIYRFYIPSKECAPSVGDIVCVMVAASDRQEADVIIGYSVSRDLKLFMVECCSDENEGFVEEEI